MRLRVVKSLYQLKLGFLESIYNRFIGTSLHVMRRRVQQLEQDNEQLRQDILKREEAERILYRNEEKFRSIIEQSRDGIILIDQTGFIVEWNQAQEHLTGLKRDEVVGKPSWDIFYQLKPAEQKSPEMYEQIKTGMDDLFNAENVPSYQFEEEMQRGDDDGIHRSIQYMVFPIRYHDGKLYVCISRDITERKRIEKAWRESEQRYRVLFENAGDAIILHDLNGRIIDANDAACELTGYTHEALLHMNMDEIGSADTETPTATYSWRLRNLNQAVLEFTYRRQDGALLPVEVNARLIEHHDQPMILSISRDITLRKRAEEGERKQRLLAEALCDTAAALTDTLDLEGVLDRILENVGRVVPHDEVIIMLYDAELARVVRHRCYHPYEVSNKTGLAVPRFQLSSTIQQVVDVGRTFTTDDIQSNPDSTGILIGFERMRSMIGIPIRQGNRIIGLLKLGSAMPEFYNLTDVLHLQAFAEQAALAIQNAELYAAERRERILAQTFQQIAETLSGSAHLEEALGEAIERLRNAVYYDHAAVMLIEGEQLRVVIARGLVDDSQPQAYDYSRVALFYQPLSSGQPLVLSNAQQHPNSAYLLSGTCAWIGVPLVVWDIVIGFFSVSSKQPTAYSVSDVEMVTAFANQVALAIENSQLYTRLEISQLDLREAHAHLNQTARLSLAGKIAAGVAHQINNPLTAVIAQSYLLMKRLPPGSKPHKSAEMIYQSAGQAANVVQRLLDFARPTVYDQEWIDINVSVLYSISLVRAQIEPSAARLNVCLTPGLPHIQGSERHLEDLWINLLLNAKDAVSHREEGMIDISSQLAADRQAVEVVISDNGVGMSEEVVSHIFEPFFTTKQNGNGLGLSICYDVVTRHRGTIQVVSIEGHGTTFTVTLPLENTVS